MEVMEMSNIKKKTLKIQGMTCSQCEKIIHKVLLKVVGISEAKVSFKESGAHIVYDSKKTTEEHINRAICDAGYEVLPDNRLAGKSGLTPLQIAGVGVILAALYMVVSRTVGFNFIPELQSSMSYSMLFVVGILTSLHCIAMCGGINLSQCLTPRKDGTFTPGWKPSLLYNGGRVISYTIVGGIVGGLGSVVSFSGGARGLIAILAGAFMVIMGTNMLGLVPGLRRFHIQMPAGIRNKLMGKGGERGPLVVGILNGLMPCGPLQAMQLYALGTGSIAAGALSMFFFSLGTVPLMFGFGAISTMLSKRFTKNMLRFSAVLVILLGVIMMQRGLSLSGTPVFALPNAKPATETAISAKDFEDGAIAKIENGIQTVKAEVLPSAYPEIIVQKGVPVRFNLHADSSNLNGCNRSIVIPDFNIQKQLQAGDNIVEFTPLKTGTYGYTCWMGMISSKITVVDSLIK
jgi:uncharacterized protein